MIRLTCTPKVHSIDFVVLHIDNVTDSIFLKLFALTEKPSNDIDIEIAPNKPPRSFSNMAAQANGFLNEKHAYARGTVQGCTVMPDLESARHIEAFIQLRHALSSALTIPMLLLPRRGRPVRKKELHEMHPMAYLDALRGYLALIIFTAHCLPRTWGWISPFVLSVPWLQFPFRGGFASLNMFFWISGYVTTYKFVGLMQTKQFDKLLDSISSFVFRRYFRLFLPVIAVTFVTMIAVKTGIAIPPEERANAIQGNPLIWWLKDSAQLMNPYTHAIGFWSPGSSSGLVDIFWSIVTEFRSSMILSVFCVGTCKISSRNRKILILMMCPALIYWQMSWSMMAFLGMWFSERRQERRRAASAQIPMTANGDHKGITEISGANLLSKNPSELGLELSPTKRWALIILFIYSFIDLKDPYDTDKKMLFPHNILNVMVPETGWWPQSRMHMHLAVGCMMMLYPLDRLSILQRPLLTPFSQFLGELSFGIYAVHFPIRWIVWDPRYVKWQLKLHGPQAMDKFWNAFPGWLAMAIVVLWAAELFRRLDWQVVRFCKYLEYLVFE